MELILKGEDEILLDGEVEDRAGGRGGRKGKKADEKGMGVEDEDWVKRFCRGVVEAL